MTTKKLWFGFLAVMTISFAVLLYYGREIYRQAPPIPDKVVTTSGTTLFTGQDIKDGQNVWQSMGGQELGSVWGHGAYQAPDWSADWLHKEAIFILNQLALIKDSVAFDNLSKEQQAFLKVSLQKELRTNTYNHEDKTLTISDLRAEAFSNNSSYYSRLFTDDPSLDAERDTYSIQKNTLKDSERVRKLNAFFFWVSWTCVTERPGQEITYTNNWPAEELVANKPTGALLLWTGFSVIMLLAGIGIMVWFYAKRRGEGSEHNVSTNFLLKNDVQTPSQKAILKYFWTVSALLLVQVLMGIITAHYTVEGQALYGIPLSDWLPYSISRTWHVQIAIFWIATSWLATGLYYAPAISGVEPKFQRLGVNFLFGALLVIVLGSLIGQWMGVMQKLGLAENFWFGHQGYEYVDLGRFWQLFLFIGLIIWLLLMGRAIWPALKQKSESRSLLILFLISSIAIAAFYGAGLMWGQQTNLAIAEYWRWWVVHLWVEGFFEVFAAVVTAFLFVRMQIIKASSATTAVLFSTIVFLSGGILGTFHHLYFTGTPTAVLALGATFSALEVVPLVLMGFEAYDNLKLSRSNDWIKAYKWPIYSFIAVAFWNLVGAGIFGFLINPPIALYYMQGLNTTPVHGHTALFGVYGMLGIGLMLFVLRDMNKDVVWKERWVKFAFWSINIGLAAMVLISVLPVGLAQTVASVQDGLWYARSAEFMQQPYIITFKWLRMIGDTLFAAGSVALAWFIFGLATGWSIKKK
ncbi:MAG TPA: nitric oxide reductase large subunit [Marinilabiliales bacterium]|nr:MAG: nitric oxide reductase large subunit [Bacteroidetes bacterium GWA2_40_14]OFX61101.1 MAG: nitric oxide reductase large subunit [Bacteroidetes bacterium GWC2_40_13]OFX72705.1 MAG: nitric oxide reductase large subunit [Bacteroidetes bacterium GWD2_40_43]OFX91335.1 MAG: nitric oxide reductase large subunit [Bacteroidetes bacterium GWE2_40_63]OFY19405.1 MAG: nitric oxide reductase large subunit [Bacteroidetes bacterium GWF2_40_13]OFZ25556.1 MAG: nitric oxide reductase large subunit [Bactero